MKQYCLNKLDSSAFLPLCFVVFIVIRLSLIILLPVTMASDAEWYFGRAQGIASGLGYSESGYPTAFWPVGYPGFLGVLFFLFGKHEAVGQIANLILSSFSFYLTLLLTRQLFKSERIARLSVLLITLYPNNAAYVPMLMTEVYFTFLVLLGAYIFISRKGWFWYVLAGLIFGLACLTKPQVLFLPGLIALLKLLDLNLRQSRYQIISATVVLYFAMSLILIPWAWRNTTVFGETVLLSTNGGYTLLTGNNPSARGDYTENDPLVNERKFSVKDQVASDRRAKALAMQWIKDNPAQFIKLIPMKIFRLWAPDGEAEWFYQLGYEKYNQQSHWFRLVRILNQAYYFLIIIGAVVAAFNFKNLKSSTSWPYSVFPIVFALYITCISVVFSGQSRFHYPVMPWISMIAAWQLIYTFENRQKKVT